MKNQSIQRILSTLNYTAIDRIYQQISDELGMIFTLHHVRPNGSRKFEPNLHLAVRPDFLEAFIQLLQRRGIEFVSMDEVHKRILKPIANRRFAAITFDDGYRDNMQHAVPVLRKYGVPYTIYVCPGFVDNTASIWWEDVEMLVRQQDRILFQEVQGPVELDCTTPAKKLRSFLHIVDYMTDEISEDEQRQRVRELCWLYKIDNTRHLKQEVMTWDELHDLSRDPLCTLGAHTLTHRALARLPESEAHEEIIQSAAVLEAELGQRPVHFAYPYGYRAAAASREFDMTKKAGFKTAVTTRPGMLFKQHRDHLTALPRISLNGHFQRMRYVGPLATGLPTRLGRGMRRLNVG